MSRSVLDSINAALLAALQQDESVLLLGEDILDPYGGAFKATRGCSTAFPNRVIAAPISEAGLAGLCAGLALRGQRPVLEIMFGDFTTLLADQLINHISKFRWMYNNSVDVPLLVRTPMGGRRGYGTTHSQTLEKLFLGVPGLTVAAPLNLDIPGYGDCSQVLLKRLITESKSPVLFIENKLQYLLPLYAMTDLSDFAASLQYSEDDSSRLYPTLTLTIKGAPAPALTLVAYGYMAELARQAQLKLAYEHEIFIELVLPTRLSPFDTSAIEASAARTGHLLTVEEGTLSLGWGAEIAARVASAQTGVKVARLAAAETPVPASQVLEKAALPQVDDIVSFVQKMV